VEIVFLLTGRTENGPILELMETYERRLVHYHPYRRVELAGLSGSDTVLVKKKEAKAQMDVLRAGDFLVLLDENGASFSSRKWSSQLQKWMNSGPKRLVFCAGGAHGFDDSVLDLARAKLSLSPMTFSHQLVRPVFLEQLYRALSLLNGEAYHHD